MPPPHQRLDYVGGRINKLVSIYINQRSKKLCHKHSERCYVSLFSGLSLQQYVIAREADCNRSHVQPCSLCNALLSTAEKVQKNGCVLLSEAFRLAFPSQTYRVHNALERFLQMPLVAIHVGDPSSGSSAWYLLEHMEGVNVTQLLHFNEALLSPERSTGVTPSLDRNNIRSILSLALSDRERELIRYTAFKASGLSVTAARWHFGFQNMAERCKRVEACIEEARKR